MAAHRHGRMRLVLAAAAAGLALPCAPSSAAVLAPESATHGGTTPLSVLEPHLMSFYNATQEKIRLLEGEEEREGGGALIDVGAALAAAEGGGPVHDEHEHEEAEHEDGHENHEEHEAEEEHGHEEDHSHDEHEGNVHDEHLHEGHAHDDHHDEFHAESLATEDKPKPWGEVILATLVINLAALSGLVLLLIPAIHRGWLKLQGLDAQGADEKGRLFDVCVPAFAVGALLATAVFLVLPEALHLIEGKHSDHSAEHSDHADHRFLAEDDHDHGTHSEGEGGYEGSHAGHDESSESVTTAKFGVAVLGGFLLPMVFGMAFHRHGPSAGNDEPEQDASSPDQTIHETKRLSTNVSSVVSGTDAGCDCCTKENDVETGVAVRQVADDSADRPPETIVLGDDNKSDAASQAKNDSEDTAVNAETEQAIELPAKVAIDYRLVASVVVGDAFCNFVDGLFVGAAFLSCSWATTLSILMVTLFHELPQEMADFLLLTRFAGLSTLQACGVNFGSGLIVTLGGIVVLAGSTSDGTVSVILAMAGGCYINIAASETVPRMQTHVHSLADHAAMIFSFIVGTVPIGLILLKHEHC